MIWWPFGRQKERKQATKVEAKKVAEAVQAHKDRRDRAISDATTELEKNVDILSKNGITLTIHRAGGGGH